MFEYTKSTDTYILNLTLEQRNALILGAIAMHDALVGNMTLPECIDAYVAGIEHGDYEFTREDDGVLYVRGV